MKKKNMNKPTIREETKCPCDNLQNGDIIRVDENGDCVVCGRYSGACNKPTIREEWYLDKESLTLTPHQQAYTLEFFLNKIKEVVGETSYRKLTEGELEHKSYAFVDGVSVERQRILKEFGIIK